MNIYMNKDMMKSLRQAMLSTAAAALVSIGFTACSEDTFVTQNTTAPVDGSYQVCIPATKGGAGTRAIAYNSKTGGYDATFEMTDKIIVYNVTQKAESSKLTEGGWTQLTTLSPDANGKSANLVGELGFSRWDETGTRVAITPAKGDELMLLYNNIYYGDWAFNYSNWSGEIIPDYAIAKVTIESINDGVIKTSAASFENPQSAYRINFTGIGSGVKIKKVTIESEQRKLVNYYEPFNIEWPNNFGVVNYSYEGEGTDQQELTFMLRFANRPDYETSAPGDVITFRAVGSDGHYYVGTKTVENELVDGLYYLADVAMTDAGLAMTLTNNTTGELVELYEWTSISTKDAAYTAANVGYNNVLGWYGGDNTLTFKNLTLRNEGNVIRLYTDESDIENTRMHHLILDGENILCSNDDADNFNVNQNSSLIISGLSGGKLIIEKGGMHVFENSTMTIESGEIIVNSRLGMGGNSKLKVEGGVLTTNALEAWDETANCVISKDGKLRIAKDSYVREGFIKAASGYVLNTATEGDYVVYTVKEAPAPKDLSTVTTADLGSIVCSDGKVYVPNCGLPEGVSTVGMIANISSTGHGLAVAMSKIKVRKDFDDGGWTTYEYFSWDDSAEYNNGKTATDIFNDWSSNNSVTFGTWRIATKEDCQNMILSCRIDGDATEASDNNMISNGFKSKLIEAGIIYDDYLYCWTNTTVDNDWRFYMSLERNGEDSIANFYTTDNSATSSILPVLEF